MFTGIVQGVGEVTGVADRQGIRRFQIQMPKDCDKGLATGASIAINGLCLTVVGWNDQGVQFDVIDESLRLSLLITRTERHDSTAKADRSPARPPPSTSTSVNQ